MINCTEIGSLDILDLSDHTDVLVNATLMHFDRNDIVEVKKLPPSRVKYLSLRHNRIRKIDDSAFTDLKSLVELDLSHNSLTTESLNPDVFKVLSIFFLKSNRDLGIDLIVFVIQHSVMQITHKDSSRPGTLVHLHLDYNNIHSLLPLVFKELHNLASLTLAGNPLSVINPSTSFALTSLPMLKV